METACERCKQPLENAKFQESIRVVLHTSALLVCGPNLDNKSRQEWHSTGKKKWKIDRDTFLWDLKKNISALRNSGGGIVFIHIQDLNPEDRCLDPFHELVDERLNAMIEDGSLFVGVYKKDWLTETSLNDGIVVISVLPSASVVTLDFKTKVPLDNSVIDPSTATIVKLLVQGLKVPDTEPILRGLDYPKLRESRHVQVKAVFDRNGVILTNIDSFIDHVWGNLRLKEYVTAFSKLDGGGSIYFGILEEGKKYETYTTKELKKTGFAFKLPREEFISKLQSKVKAETVVLVKHLNGVTFTKRDNLVKIAFHPVKDDKKCYVIEVAVAGVNGLVFYDKLGPEAYLIADNNNVERIGIEKWHKLQLKEAKVTHRSN